MRADGPQQVGGAAVVQEEDALAETPQRGGPELVPAGVALQDVVGEPGAHRVERYVGVEIGVPVGEGGHRGVAGCPERWRMTERAADVRELLASAPDRCGAARGVR